MARYSMSLLQKAVASKNYKWFDDGKPYYLNIIGVRKNNPVPNRFDDYVTLSLFNGHEWKYFEWIATTDPGSYWLLNPGNVKGTAILKPGQYVDCWQLGLHQGKYEALVQRKPVTVLRDNNKNNLLDFQTLQTDTGLFGINIHRANEKVESTQVDRWSAGCQVIANPPSFNHLIFNIKESLRLGRQNWFSYTLLTESDL